MPHREEMKVPSWYSARLHYAGTSGVSLPLIVVGVILILRAQREGTPGSALLGLTLLYLVLASGVEYLAHRSILHRRLPLLGHAFVEHTLRHHRWFTDRDIEATDDRDYHQVLFPLWGVVLLQYGLNLPLCLLGYRFFGGAVAGVGLLVGPGFFFLYESVHAICHFKERNPIFRIPFLRALREHHLVHHVPALMGRANFNIVFPLWDVLLGTRVKAG